MSQHLTRPLLLTSASLLLMVPSAFGDTSLQSQVSQLERQVHTQQKVLHTQASELKQLSRKSRQEPTSTKTMQVHVTYQKTPYTDLPVLQRASSGSATPILPTPTLKFQAGKSTLSINGFINAAMMGTNDGKNNDIFFGSGSPTSRLTLKDITQINPDFSAGATLELGFSINSLRTVDSSNPANSNLNMRVAELFVQTKLGKISLGQGSMATDNIAYSDFSGTGMISRATLEDIGGGIRLIDKATGSPEETILVGTYINGLDGLGRRGRVRYDSPTVAGFSLATSAGANNQQDQDVALKYAKQFGRTAIAAQVGYTSQQSLGPGPLATPATGHVLNLSAGFLLPCGLNLTGSYANLFAKQSGRNDPHYVYIKPGYQHRFLTLGMTAISADFARYDNMETSKSDATSTGFQVVQSVNPLNLAIYGGYRYFHIGKSGLANNFRNVKLATLGAMIKF